jgi:hypothetical protein
VARVLDESDTHEHQSKRDFYRDGGQDAGPGMAGEEFEDPKARES